MRHRWTSTGESRNSNPGSSRKPIPTRPSARPITAALTGTVLSLPSGHHRAVPAAPAPQLDLPVLARINGEPLRRIPNDLYIPPDALEILLDTFEGPLDLLLYLIRRQNFDILDIPMAQVTKQYLAYVDETRHPQPGTGRRIPADGCGADRHQVAHAPAHQEGRQRRRSRRSAGGTRAPPAAVRADQGRCGASRPAPARRSRLRAGSGGGRPYGCRAAAGSGCRTT